jgi:hypothetical protein
MHTKFLPENLKYRERDHTGDLGVDGRTLLKWIFEKWDLVVWTGLNWLWAFVNKVLISRILKKAGDFLTR